ncbi:bacterial transcriptional activator domain-containing protein [Lysinibacillus capsici]|uniref:bacterial transcriptional activator domain-containing protein n=1 Tax=Lysinibacillus capsici TaxID=2115968 RepID=UPI0039FD2FC7
MKISSPLLSSGYKLVVENIVVDVEQWLSHLKSLPLIQQTTLDEHEQLFQMYTGDYLWAESERERLRRLWLHHAQQLSEFYIRNESYNAAIKVQEKVQELFADAEDNYFTLMKLYELLNNSAAVEEQYWLLKKMLLANIKRTLHYTESFPSSIVTHHASHSCNC